MHTADPMQRKMCGRKTRGGYPCKLRPMHGQTVCRMHGGSSPQALAKAEDRMRALVHPSLLRLSELIQRADADSVSLQAVKYVLDYAGFKAAEKVNSDGKVVIEVEYVGQTPLVIDVPLNGHALHAKGPTEESA